MLVEVTESYREAIRATVRHFTGEDVSPGLIQKFKNQGGWNNDWDLIHPASFAISAGMCPTMPWFDKFNEFFFGANGDGLILLERWIPRDGFFSELQIRLEIRNLHGPCSIRAGSDDAAIRAHIGFDPVVTADDVANPKPAPDGLRLVQKQFHPALSGIWATRSTMPSARSWPGVPFVGIAAQSNPRYSELENALENTAHSPC